MHRDVQESYVSMTRILGFVFFVKTIVGVLLIVAGCITAFLILQVIFRIIQDPEELAIVQRIAQIGREGAEISLFGNSVKFPPVTLEYVNIALSYVIVLILLSIGAGIAKVFLSAGGTLAQAEIKSLLEKLGEELARLWNFRTATTKGEPGDI